MKIKEVVTTEFINTAKVMNELTNGKVMISSDSDLYIGWKSIDVGSKKPTMVDVKLYCDSDSKKELEGKKLTVFDRDIMDAVFSLYRDGEEDLTPTMIIRAYAGDLKKVSTKNFQKKVEGTMDKLSNLMIQIECGEQFEMMGISTKNGTYVYKGKLIPAKKMVTQENEGKDKTVYHMCGTSVLYQYALKMKHIGCVSAELLNIPGKRTSTEDTMIARYLIRRINAMKNKKNNVKNTHIVYQRKKDEGMFRTLCFLEESFKNWADKKTKLHKTVIRYLDHFCELGYITGYVILKKKRSVYGVEIEL